MARRHPTERAEQRAVVEWLMLQGATFTHVPNFHSGIRKGKNMWAALRARRLDGVQDGFPDLLIFSRPKRGWAPAAYDMLKNPADDSRDDVPLGVAIELKALDGNKPTEKQRWWLDQFERMGWISSWMRGNADAINFLEVLGYGN